MRTPEQIQERIAQLEAQLKRVFERIKTSVDVGNSSYAINGIPHEIKALKWVLSDE